MDLCCERCGLLLRGSVADDPDEALVPAALVCPSCGGTIVVGTGDAEPEEEFDTNPVGGEPSGEEESADTRVPLPASLESADATLFHPGMMAGWPSAEELPEGEAAKEEVPSVDPPGTELMADPAAPEPPLLAPDVDAYFLILGAPVGRERRPLFAARTIVGREGDVTIEDSAASRHHFQVEAMGPEFYIRDLESGNGTFVNGRSVRYCQLVPGDEVRVGRTVLVFRTADDGLSGAEPES